MVKYSLAIMNQGKTWQNRFSKFQELVACIIDFKSCDSISDYEDFIGNCINTLEGLKGIMTLGMEGVDDTCPEDFICPLSNMIMKDPVVLALGEVNPFILNKILTSKCEDFIAVS